MITQEIAWRIVFYVYPKLEQGINWQHDALRALINYGGSSERVAYTLLDHGVFAQLLDPGVPLLRSIVEALHLWNTQHSLVTKASLNPI